MVRLDVVVGVDAPHLVRPADEVDAELRQDVGRVVQRLGEVLDAAPHEHPEGTRVGLPRAPHDPLGPFGRASDPAAGGHVDRPLLRHAAQCIGGRVARGVRLQRRVVLGVAVDDLEDVLAAARSPGRRDEALHVEHVGVEEEVHHRLDVVGVGASDVRRHDDSGPRIGRWPLVPLRPRHGRRRQRADRPGNCGRGHGSMAPPACPHRRPPSGAGTHGRRAGVARRRAASRGTR